MYLIIGLGNPTKQYEKTRHNIGFDVIDALADKYNISVNSDTQSNPEISYSFYNDDEVTVVNVVADSPTGNFEISNNGDDIQLGGVNNATIVVSAGNANDESSLEVVAEKEWIGLLENEDYTTAEVDLYQLSLPNTDASDNREVYMMLFGISSILFVVLIIMNRRWEKER